MKHENYELMNLLGYGLAKFDSDFFKEFGVKTKTAFYDIFVKNNLAKTRDTIKNKMDLFAPFFPQNPRKGWWQKGETYIHRKKLIDSMFGDESAKNYAEIVKLFLKQHYNISLEYANNESKNQLSILTQTKFYKMQEVGLEAEIFFVNHYQKIEALKGIKNLIDTRIYGDGYDFLAQMQECEILCEIKGIRQKTGRIRLTQKEFDKAQEYKENYLLVAVCNLQETPNFKAILNPIQHLSFTKKIINTQITEYHFGYL